MTSQQEASVSTPTDGVAAAHRARSFLCLCVASGTVGFAITMQLALNNNFVVQEMHLSGFQQGILEAFRESCGIIGLLLLALLAGLAEPLLGAGVLVLMGVGLSAYVFIPDFYWLVIASLVWSQGFHMWVPLPSSMALALAEPGRTGRRLSQLQTAGAAGSGVALLAALGLNHFGASIRSLYLLAGCVLAVGAVACFVLPKQIKTPGPRLVFRRKYWLYYVLTFLEGWRKQIVVAFAGFLLVQKYHTSLTTMLWIFVVIQAFSYLLAPRVGWLIDHLGERKILVFYYSCLTVCFLGYVFVANQYVLYGLYIIDSAFFVFSMAQTTYVSRIVTPQERTPTLAMGVAMNHVAAVSMPLLGGLTWKYLGYQWTFVIGIAAAAASIAASLKIPRHVQK